MSYSAQRFVDAFGEARLAGEEALDACLSDPGASSALRAGQCAKRVINNALGWTEFNDPERPATLTLAVLEDAEHELEDAVAISYRNWQRLTSAKTVIGMARRQMAAAIRENENE